MGSRRQRIDHSDSQMTSNSETNAACPGAHRRMDLIGGAPTTLRDSVLTVGGRSFRVGEHCQAEAESIGGRA
jgi:hypothetical protein